MSGPQISIIIPVYNTGIYLKQCIDSIICQSFNDYEMILVDDGSKDNSPAICDTYSLEYPFIQTIHQTNMGVAAARNTGIEKAAGEYLLFLDSDDFIKEEALQLIINTVYENAAVDVIFLEAEKVFANGSTEMLNDGYKREEIVNHSRNDVFKHLGELNKYPGAAWSKLIRKNIVIENRLSFMNGRVVGEDLDFVMNVMLHSNVFNYCSSTFYCYRQRRIGAVSTSHTIHKFADLLSVIEGWIDLAKTEHKDVETSIYSMAAYEYQVLLPIYAKLSKIDARKYKGKMKELKWVLDYRHTSTAKIIRICISIINVSATAKLLAFFLHFRELMKL